VGQAKDRLPYINRRTYATVLVISRASGAIFGLILVRIQPICFLKGKRKPHSASTMSATEDTTKKSKRQSIFSKLLPTRSKSPSATQDKTNGTVNQSESKDGPSEMVQATATNGTAQGHHGRPIRTLIIGAGSRGHSYARAIQTYSKLPSDHPDYISAVVVGVVEPIAFKRNEFGSSFIAGWDSATKKKQSKEAQGLQEGMREGIEFEDWTDWVKYERARRERIATAGSEVANDDAGVQVDAVFICVLDELHVPVIEGIKGLSGIHIMCEKPLATNLDGCMKVFKAHEEEKKRRDGEETVFGICHVLRYSPHNGMLRELVREKKVVGDIVSVEHTEPVGWWHFSHSYVRLVLSGMLYPLLFQYIDQDTEATGAKSPKQPHPYLQNLATILISLFGCCALLQTQPALSRPIIRCPYRQQAPAKSFGKP
jgi:predicted dehydrogenase